MLQIRRHVRLLRVENDAVHQVHVDPATVDRATLLARAGLTGSHRGLCDARRGGFIRSDEELRSLLHRDRRPRLLVLPRIPRGRWRGRGADAPLPSRFGRTSIDL